MCCINTYCDTVGKMAVDEDVAEETGTETTDSLGEFAEEKFSASARIAVAMIADAVLFLVWMGVAWTAKIVAAYAEQNGVHEYFAAAFLWISSASTLTLAIVYIVADIRKEFRRAFPKKHTGSNQAS
jgi:hypothetical protein